VNVHENVHESASGSASDRNVDGWKTPACAAGRSGVPASTNRFHSGARPLAAASRTAARHGRFAKARSDRIPLRGGPTSAAGGRLFQGFAVKKRSDGP